MTMIVDLICTNANCINFDIAITYDTPAINVICGPCGKPIVLDAETVDALNKIHAKNAK